MAPGRRQLERECERAAVRARSLRVRDFRWRLEADAVVLEGDAATPEGIDSATKIFAATSAREVRNRMRHAPMDSSRPGLLHAPGGYVHIVEMGPHAARLAESVTWEVRPGDTLASIARTVYGDEAASDRLVNANRNQIGPDGFVHAGQRLRIPL